MVSDSTGSETTIVHSSPMTNGPPTPRNHRLDLYVAGVILCGLGALVASVRAVPLEQLGGDHHLVFLAFCLLLLITELRPMPALTSSSTITASWTFAFTLTFLAPVGGALLAVAAVALFVDLRAGEGKLRRVVLKRAVFNSAQFTLSLAVAALAANQFTDLLAVARGESITIRWMFAVPVAFGGVVAYRLKVE